MAEKSDAGTKVKSAKVSHTKMYVLLGSATGAGFFVLLGMFTMLGVFEMPFDWMDFLILALIVMMGPYGFYESSRISKIKKIEEHLPDFLRDVAEAGRFGMTLADAIVVASSGRYGDLTPEIKKMAAQIDWGVPATEALRMFSERIGTPLVNRMMAIVIKASDAGGNIADVLTMVAHDTKETQLMAKEKSIAMSTYIAVIYIAFIVFLVTIMIMNATFLPQMQKAGEAIAQLDTGGGGGAALIQTDVIPQVGFVFFISALFHAIGDGFVAGVIADGRVISGLRHSFIMTIIAFLMLRVM